MSRSLITGIVLLTAMFTLVSCTEPTQSPTSTPDAMQKEKPFGGTIAAGNWPQPADFKYEYDSWTTKCPLNVLKNCAKRQPKLSTAVEAAVATAVSGGPSAVASFFTDPSGDWNYLSSRVDSTNPSIYAHFASGNYWMIKFNEVCDHDSVNVVAYYLGHSSLSPTKANATYKLKTDL